MDKLNGGYRYFEEVNPGIIRMVPNRLQILDVGCGDGTLGEAMTNKGNVVYGIDISPKAIERAKSRMHFAAVADITRLETLPAEVKCERFDLIVLADILEHVFDPLSILMNVKPLLRPDGQLLLSIPNVANWFNRIQLLLGRWEYTVSGVMDRTHVRFFTLNTAKRLLKVAGFEVTDLTVTPYFARALAVPIRNFLFPQSKDRTPQDPTALLKSRSYRLYMNFVFPVENLIAQSWKRLFAFQFIILASPNDRDSYHFHG